MNLESRALSSQRGKSGYFGRFTATACVAVALGRARARPKELQRTYETLVFSRPRPGAGSFSKLPTTFDEEEGKLIATTDSFSEIAFANEDDPLPVELAGFDARIKSDAVRITWQTASETNNSGFDVQRCEGEPGQAEGSSWTTVSFVEGAGTTSEP